MRRSLGQDLREWEGQIHAWTWPYSVDQMRAACADVRDWAEREGWSLDGELEVEGVLQWWAFVRMD